MVVPWLRPCAPTAGSLGSIPGQGTRSHMPQLEESLCCNQRSCMLQWRSEIPCATAETRYSHTKRKKVENGATGKWNCFLHLKASEMIVRSDQISCSAVSDSLPPHESQHARPPCPSPTPGVHWDSHPSSQWCHPAISSSVVPFSSCPQSLLAICFWTCL